MESTTLITFMLQHPSASFIELWGSWDNFAAPWEMKRDSRRGRGHWTGCHKFRNIICDGNSAGFREKRDGGLMMGGTYWYYYRINGEEEHYDPSQPSTSNSPLLPGQFVNVLEVPWEKKFVSRSGLSAVAMITAIHTLNPDDRYRNPRPAPKPRLPKLMTKLDPVSFRSWSAAPPETPGSAIVQRQVKSATTAASNLFAAAMDCVHTPVSTHFYGSGGQPNPPRLRPSQSQLRPSNLPELKVKSPTNFVDKSQISYPIPLSASSAGPFTSAIALPKRQDAISRAAELLRNGQKLDLTVERISQPPNHRRAVTAGEIRPVTQFIHRRTVSDSDETVIHISPALDGPQRHSIARKPIACQVNFLSNVNISANQAEIRATVFENQTPTNGLNLVGLDVSTLSLEETPGTLQKVDLEKDLPALPSYLVPSPLFSHTINPDPKPADPSPFVLDWTYKQSRFSAWTVYSDGEEEEEDDDDDNDTDFQDGLSSTFSDIQDSGHPSPLRFSSDPFWTSSSEDASPQNQRAYSRDMVLGLSTDNYSLGSREQTPLVGIDGQAMKGMTPMEQLMHEFEYIGAALI